MEREGDEPDYGADAEWDDSGDGYGSDGLPPPHIRKLLNSNWQSAWQPRVLSHEGKGARARRRKKRLQRAKKQDDQDPRKHVDEISCAVSMLRWDYEDVLAAGEAPYLDESVSGYFEGRRERRNAYDLRLIRRKFNDIFPCTSSGESAHRNRLTVQALLEEGKARVARLEAHMQHIGAFRRRFTYDWDDDDDAGLAYREYVEQECMKILLEIYEAVRDC